jgi:anti-sigma regulatory factor (Ser/Thr protein kinase)
MVFPSESLSLTAAIEFLGPATEFARRGAEQAGLTGDCLGAVDLVLEELFANVARYSYPAGAAGEVEITWSVPKPGLLSIEMSDQGVPFDPLSRDEPGLADSLRDRPVGGLGLFLIRRLTSTLTYRRDGGRNRVRFEISASSDD